jgi:hypothetical protein
LDGAAGKKIQAGEADLRLRGGPYKYLTYKALRRLGDEHGHGVGNIFGLKELGGILSRVRAELGIDRSGADRADPNPILAQVFRHASGQAHQSPLRSAIHSAILEGVFPGQ